MGRFLKYLAGILVILFILILVGWGLLPSYMSSMLSSKAKVKVHVGSIQMTPWNIRIGDLEINNPPHSILEKALSVDSIDISAPITRYLDDNITINEIALDDVYLGLEFEKKGSSNGNWTTIMNNLNSSKEKDHQEAKAQGKETSVMISKLIITNIKIDLVYQQGNRQVQHLAPIDKIELYNISSTGGIPTSQITQIVMKEMIKNTFSKEGLKNLLDDVLNPDGASTFFQNLFQ